MTERSELQQLLEALSDTEVSEVLAYARWLHNGRDTLVAPTANPTGIRRGRQGCRVLVVDDDPGIRNVVGEILEEAGYHVTLVSDGANALLAVGQSYPDVILLDMRMPVVNGWDFAHRIRQLSVQPRIIVMTAASHATAWASEIKADAVLPKPFELDELLAVLNEQRRRLRRPDALNHVAS